MHGQLGDDGAQRVVIRVATFEPQDQVGVVIHCTRQVGTGGRRGVVFGHREFAELGLPTQGEGVSLKIMHCRVRYAGPRGTAVDPPQQTHPERNPGIVNNHLGCRLTEFSDAPDNVASPVDSLRKPLIIDDRCGAFAVAVGAKIVASAALAAVRDSDAQAAAGFAHSQRCLCVD